MNNPICYEVCNGSIVVNAVGGTSPYTYNVDNGAFGASNNLTGLCDGFHLPLAKDANGCLTSATFQLLSNPPSIHTDTLSTT
ncbi:SprB repeat-containing protein, partial [Escherichia coli]|uniref:SprB repeat-containing protein n=1 Tax=Escherichia coli TaxID=562 RepID=UPI00200C7C6D